MREGTIRCDYPEKRGKSGLVCRITGVKATSRGVLAKQCPVDERNECAEDFNRYGFWRSEIRVGGQGRD